MGRLLERGMKTKILNFNCVRISLTDFGIPDILKALKSKRLAKTFATFSSAVPH